MCMHVCVCVHLCISAVTGHCSHQVHLRAGGQNVALQLAESASHCRSMASGLTEHKRELHSSEPQALMGSHGKGNPVFCGILGWKQES